YRQRLEGYRDWNAVETRQFPAGHRVAHHDARLPADAFCGHHQGDRVRIQYAVVVRMQAKLHHPGLVVEPVGACFRIADPGRSLTELDLDPRWLHREQLPCAGSDRHAEEPGADCLAPGNDLP